MQQPDLSLAFAFLISSTYLGTNKRVGRAMPGVSTLITVTSYQNQSSAEYTAGHLQGRPPSRLLRVSPHDICSAPLLSLHCLMVVHPSPIQIWSRHMVLDR